MQEMVLKAESRDPKKIKAGNLRKEGKIPAVIYSHGETTQLMINEKEFSKMFKNGVSESQLIDVEYDGKKEKSFVKDYQVDPVSSKVLHVDFFKITYGEKVKTNIPVHLEGKSAGEKEGGVLEVFLHEIELEILPKDLVPSITIDISGLGLGAALHANDLPLPESAKVLAEGNPVICHVSEPRKAKEDTAETAEEEAAPAEKKE